MPNGLATEQPPFKIKIDLGALEKWLARAIYLSALAATAAYFISQATTKKQVATNTVVIANHETRITNTEKRLDKKDETDSETLKVLYQMKGTLDMIERRTR